MDASTYSLCIFAFSTRCFLIILQMISNAVIPDHDAGVFSPELDTTSFSWLDRATHIVLGGLRRWDAIYFSFIAENGYIYEKSGAFLPLFPMVVSFLAHLFSNLGLLHITSWILVVSIALNMFLFVLTAKGLYELGRRILGDSALAYTAAVLFCVNPASIFMTAPYSEILFLFLLVHALLGIEYGAFYASSFLISLCVLTRSNGLVAVGFILHAFSKCLAKKCFSVFHKSQFISLLQVSVCVGQFLFRMIPGSFVFVIISISSFLGYQFYLYKRFCFPTNTPDFVPTHLISYGRSQGFSVLGDPPSPWCSNTIPLSYSYIQNHYWDVGLFKYYEIRKIPNFIVATPIIILSLQSCLFFTKQCARSFRSLGMLDDDLLDKLLGFKRKRTTSSSDDELEDIDMKVGTEACFNTKALVAFVLHLFTLTLFGCCFVHIEVLTRMLFSSSPLLYWYAAWLYSQDRQAQQISSQPTKSDGLSFGRQSMIASGLRSNILYIIAGKCYFQPLLDIFEHWNDSSRAFRLLLVYFLSYFITGTILFSNFLPWT